MNVFDVDIEKLGRDLDQEGLTPNEARSKLTEAFRFMVDVRTNQAARKMLPDNIIEKQRDLITKVAAWIGQYRKSGMPGIAAQAYKSVLPAEMDGITVILTCEELVRLGICCEWRYLGREERLWVDINFEPTPDKPEPKKTFIKGDIGANFVHIFDFRKIGRDGKMMRGPRHFLPADWHNRAQIELCQALAEADKKAKEAYDAAHGKSKPIKVALEVAMEKAKTEKPEPVVVEPITPNTDTASLLKELETATAEHTPSDEERKARARRTPKPSTKKRTRKQVEVEEE